MPISFSYAAVLRSTGDVRKPLVVSSVALSLNMLLGYGLILGKLGFPAMGIQGAAIAALIARLVEFAGMIWLTYRYRTAAAATIKEMFSFSRTFATTVLAAGLPGGNERAALVAGHHHL